MKKKDTAELTTKEFSLQTGLPVSIITKMLREGKIEGTKRSGKWMISKDQIKSESVKELTQKPSSKTQDKKPEKEKAISKRSLVDFSLEEFCQKTYLTEYGVLTWIKCGKLKGYQNKQGQWRVEAESFDLPNLKHLLRD